MDEGSIGHRLGSIATLWTLVCKAHDGPTAAMISAQEQLLERYQGAIRRYLLGALHNEDDADELFQEFACRFLHGDLRGADPERGRFRDFVKGVLFHLLADFHNQRKRRPQALASDQAGPAVEPPSVMDMDRDFLSNWRDDLLARCWAALERVEKETGQPFYTVLRFRAQHADLSSTEMAEQLSAQLGKPLNAAGVRQTLHRARERYGDLLIDEVSHSLDKPSMEQVEQELGDLGLLEHCRPALKRREQDKSA
jgi:RNA polymerase sigma-70 factor (ECF subfamily)